MQEVIKKDHFQEKLCKLHEIANNELGRASQPPIEPCFTGQFILFFIALRVCAGIINNGLHFYPEFRHTIGCWKLGISNNNHTLNQ
jgi:hypothetical protein